MLVIPERKLVFSTKFNNAIDKIYRLNFAFLDRNLGNIADYFHD
jgi:hypothetical protein